MNKFFIKLGELILEGLRPEGQTCSSEDDEFDITNPAENYSRPHVHTDPYAVEYNEDWDF